MPSHATASKAAFCRSSLTKPDFYLSRWSNSKIGYPYLPAHDPGGGVPAAGGPARVACRPLAPAFVGVRGSFLPGSSAGPGSSTAWSPASQAPPGHCPARVVRCLSPTFASTHCPRHGPPGSSAVLVLPNLRLHCPARSAWPCQGRPHVVPLVC